MSGKFNVKDWMYVKSDCIIYFVCWQKSGGIFTNAENNLKNSRQNMHYGNNRISCH